MQRNAFSLIGARLWIEIPSYLRDLPKASFTKRVQSVLLSIFEEVNSFIDMYQIISKAKSLVTKV